MRSGQRLTALSPAQCGRISREIMWLIAAAALVAAVPGCVLLNTTDPYAGIRHRALSEYTSTARLTTQPISGPITLSRAIEISLANNPELAAAGYGVDAAIAQRDVAIGARLPTIGVRGSYDHYMDRHRLGPPRRIGERRTYSDGVFSADLVVSIPLFTGGRLISEIKAAELLQAASQYRLARNRQELVFNVSSVFYSILAQRHGIESLEFSQHTLKKHLTRINELIQAHKAARVDCLRTEVRIADLEQQLVRERNVLAIYNRVLTNLLGVRQGESDSTAVVGELLIDGAITPDLEIGIAKAFSQRGDYLAVRATLEAQAKRVDAARAGHWPTLSLQGSCGGRWAAGRVETSGDSSFDAVGSVGVLLDIPIFEGGRVSAAIRRERATLAADLEIMRKLELQIRLDVETAHLNVSSSLQRVKATEKSIEQAKESLRIERDKYDFGKGAITDVLDAQSALLDSQMNYYRALADYNTALAQFRLAVGETP
jgi:outer membrane protein